MELHNFKAGDRIQLHPATDHWMMGDRFAVVQSIGRRLLSVRFEFSGYVARVHPHNVLEVL